MGVLEPYQELEAQYSHWLRDSHPYTVACSSGTAALHLGLEALGLPLRRFVVVPEFTMIACARAVSLAGHRPVFVDCREDLNLNPEWLFWSTFDVVMAVHMYGRLCDMEAIHVKAGEKPVIEDLAEAHGCLPHPKTDVVCWSFYKNKIVAGEEGGMVAFRSKEHAERARSLRSLGFTENHNFLHIPRGHNYRMSNLHAHPILESLANVQSNIQKRFEVMSFYDRHIPEAWKMPFRQVPWVYDLRLPPGVSVEAVVDTLHERGVPGARCGFKCMSEQPEFQQIGNKDYQTTQAFEMSRRIMYLPIHTDMTETVVASHVSKLAEIVYGMTCYGK
jgi:perosamine synthetase